MALVVFTGGARCGKSKAAINLALTREKLGIDVTFAAFGDRTAGADSIKQIENAKQQRPKSFSTIEGYGNNDWWSDVPEDDLLVIDSLEGYLESLVKWYDDNYEASTDSLKDSGERGIIKLFGKFLDDISSRPGDTIVVTSEVGGGLEPTYDPDRFFRDLLGLANRMLVDVADSAYFVVCGRLIDLKGLSVVPRWPED